MLGPWAWFSYDREQLRVDVADLQVDLVGRTFLGMTVGCARCHDHKFDPIPNKDYFALGGHLPQHENAVLEQHGRRHQYRPPS